MMKQEKNVNGLIKEAISSTIKLEDENLVIELLEFLHNDKKIKTLTDTTELNDDAILHATQQQRSETLTIILKWIQNNRNKKFNHRSKFNPNQGCQVIHPNKSGAPKSNHGAMVSAAKRNDYERVKILFKYGYR